MSRKKPGGIVYSTNPDFSFDPVKPEMQTLPPSSQRLYIWLEKKGRGGKTVSLIKGFEGSQDDLEALASRLKAGCGTGGSVKDGCVIIQGDFRDKMISLLAGWGYVAKKAGG